MPVSAWELWLVAALLLGGAELLYPALVLLGAGLACLPAGVAAALGAGFPLQLALFAAAAVAEVPLLARYAQQRRRAPRLTGNADAIVGRRVTIVESVSESADGVVLLTGEHWKARSLAGTLAAGTEAQVVEREGLLLHIVPLARSLP